jgi:hypothetical protein
MPDLTDVSGSAKYTSVDLNTVATTDLYSPSNDGMVYGVYLLNGGSSAEVDLVVTDGSSTATLQENGAGANMAFGDTLLLGSGDTLQADVVTKEGSAQTNTAVVITAE